MRFASILAVALCTAVGAPSLAPALNPEPTGFEKLKFGISVDEVRKAYPDLQKSEASRKAYGPGHPKVERFVLFKHRVEGLEKPTDVDLLFWGGRFWIALVHFGENDPAKTQEFLKQRYGPPDYSSAEYLSWTGKTAAVLADLRDKNFEVHDEGISNEARREIFGARAVSGGGTAKGSVAANPATPSVAAGSASPTAAPTPAATPANK